MRPGLFARTVLLSTLALASCQGDDTTTTTSGSGGSAGTGTTTDGGGGTTTTSGGAGGTGAGGTGSTTGPIGKAASCADTFGDALTDDFGRLDGTVLAVVKPTDVDCALPNSDHLIVQVTMNGAAYRMVVNIQSDFADPEVQYLAIAHALPAPAWSEGWHPGIHLGYATDFGVHSDEFVPHPLAELADIVTDEITIGQKISVYATSSGGASAHKVHRNNGVLDGAIVLDPEAAEPRVLLFHFSDQVF